MQAKWDEAMCSPMHEFSRYINLSRPVLQKAQISSNEQYNKTHKRLNLPHLFCVVMRENESG